MWFKNLLKSATSTLRRRRTAPRPPQSRRLQLEALEDRCLPSYTIIGLGMPAVDINNSAQIVGGHFLWQNGVKTDLGTLGGSYSEAFAINDGGQVVGMSYTSTDALRAFLLTPEDTNGNGTADRWFRDTNGDGANDLMRDLGTLGGNDVLSLARDVNNLGQVVGQTSNGRAFLWQNGVSSDLGAGIARAINDAGLITGNFITSGTSHAFLWKNGTMTDLGWSNSGGNDINSSGQLVADGSLWTPTVPNGTTGTFTYLDPLPPLFPEWGIPASKALGINNTGHAVGYTLEGEAEWGSELYRATLWADGVVEELPLGIAVAINDAGQIVGDNYLLTPIPLDLPLVAISNATMSEGNSGTTDAVFTVSLSEPSSQTVTVHYATQDGGGAVAGSDYLATSGTLTFAPGQTSQSISVAMVGDRMGEASETFAVVLSNPSGAILVDPSATGTILDDEPSIDGSSVRVSEGNSGTFTALVTVSLSRAYDQPVTVDFVAENGGAEASGDYLPASGSLTFAPGQLTQQVAVAVVGDRSVEFGQEDFFLVLSNPSSNASAGLSGRVEIWDDEPRISISPGYLAITEGNSGTTDAVFTVSLSAAYDQDVTVDYATSDDGGYDPASAVAGIDYLATAETLCFTPGQTSQTIRVPVIGDQVSEWDEYFYLNLGNASSNAALSSSYGLAVILNDEPPQISIYDVYWQEGNTGTTNVTFSVGLSFASTQVVSVYYATANGSATAGSDYQAASGMLTFAPGETWKTITVPVIGDRIGETNETFFAVLGNPTNATIADGSGQGTIVDDEPRVSINDVSKSEGRSGSTVFTFIVTLSVAYDVPVTMNFATADGTAKTSDSDYVANSGTITFAPGETSKTISVVVKGDKKKEANENFFLDLSDLSGYAVFLDSRGTGTILNDD